MNKLVDDCFKNPIKLEIYLRIKMMKATTAKELLQVLRIPPASLYRYLNKMVEDGILQIKEENKVRGVWEKVYEIALDSTEQKIPRRIEMDEKIVNTLSDMYIQFAKTDNKNGTNHFLHDSVFASEYEIAEAIDKIKEILSSLQKNEATIDRKRYTFGVVVITKDND